VDPSCSSSPCVVRRGSGACSRAECSARCGADPKAPRSWSDIRVNLGEFSGEKVELELVTRAAEPGPTTVAFWGTPVVLAPGASPVPFNILFVVIDALRGDAVAATHSPALDERMARAPVPPLDAWLPRVPEVARTWTPSQRVGWCWRTLGPPATWSRPGTIAMLAGLRSGTVGLNWPRPHPAPERSARLLCHEAGISAARSAAVRVVTRAFVNNFYMIGYAGAGVDMGFEGVVDHRYATLDTEKVNARHPSPGSGRTVTSVFALFVNYNSPHGPYEPRASSGGHSASAARTQGPDHSGVHGGGPQRRCGARPALGRARRARDPDETLVVVTGDHGETLSQGTTESP